tara:strand:+ start:746 stop:1429 length:684 start_codon:yes stop_codon:yes gene_type:complete
MGFLRKVGRKIKKGVKKLFSSKFGSLIGGIGLSMMLGPVISKAFNGIKGFFTKGVADTTAGQITTTATTSSGASAAVVDNTVTGAVDKIINTDGIMLDITKPSLETFKTQTAEILNPSFKDLSIGDKFKVAGQTTKEYLGEDFLPDTARSVAGTLAVGAIQGEPEEQFISGGVASQPMSENAQGAYLSEVQNQIPNLPATNFQQLNQSLLFGTLSPQYLLGQSQVYS